MEAYCVGEGRLPNSHSILPILIIMAVVTQRMLEVCLVRGEMSKRGRQSCSRPQSSIHSMQSFRHQHRKRQQSSMDGTVRFRQNHCRPWGPVQSTLWYRKSHHRPQTSTESTLWYKQSHNVPHRQTHSYTLSSKRNQNKPKSSQLPSQNRPQHCILLSKRSQNEPERLLFKQAPNRAQDQTQCTQWCKRGISRPWSCL